MEAGRAGLAGDRRFRFARRLITRPAMAGAEDHDSCDEAAFRDAEARGQLALSWRAPLFSSSARRVRARTR